MTSDPLTAPAGPQRRPGPIATFSLGWLILMTAGTAELIVALVGFVLLTGRISVFSHKATSLYQEYEAAPRIAREIMDVGFSSHGTLGSLASLAGVPVALFIAVALSRLYDASPRAFLGLRWPTVGQALAWGAAIVAVDYGLFALLEVLEVEVWEESVLDNYRTALFLPLLYLALVVAVPIVEEVLFRGFLLEGWRRTRLGIAGSVALTSLFWTVLHSYAAPVLAVIFCEGIVLAVARLRTGSTYLAIGMHGLVNLLALVNVGLFLANQGTEHFLEKGRAHLGKEQYWEAFLAFREAERHTDGPCVECQLGLAEVYLADFEPRRAAEAAKRILESAPPGEEARRARVLLCLARSKDPLPRDFSLEDLQPNERPEAGRPVAGTGGVERPRLLRYEEPVYPEAARLRRHQGTVTVQSVIDEEGCVTDARVLRGIAPDLDAAALEAVQRWVFQPATFQGRPVKVYYSVKVNFQLEQVSRPGVD